MRRLSGVHQGGRATAAAKARVFAHKTAQPLCQVDAWLELEQLARLGQVGDQMADALLLSFKLLLSETFFS